MTQLTNYSRRSNRSSSNTNTSEQYELTITPDAPTIVPTQLTHLSSIQIYDEDGILDTTMVIQWVNGKLTISTTIEGTFNVILHP